MKVAEEASRTETPTATGCVDVSRLGCGYGMPGRVTLAPSVWLCCVYFAAQENDHIDPVTEAFRLDTLLRDAATAWAEHSRAANSRAGKCIFSFNPGRPMDDPHASPPHFNLSVTVQANDAADWATRIELEN